MAVTFQWDTENHLLRTVASGQLSEEQMLDYIREVWKRPDRADFDEIADYRELDASSISPALMLKATQLSTQLNRERKIYRVAFVVAGKLGYGVGRQYEAFREATPTITRMFLTLEEAEQWIHQARAQDKESGGVSD